MSTHITVDTKYNFLTSYETSKKIILWSIENNWNLMSIVYLHYYRCIVNQTTHSFLYFFYNMLQVTTNVAEGSVDTNWKSLDVCL